MSLNRRSFFRRSGLIAASAVSAPSFVRAAGVVTATPGEKPRHIIHLVADGMSMATLTCADHLSQHMRRKGLTWIDLYNRREVVSSLMNVRALNSIVTDSAASASAWGSGSRVVNGAVNVLPDGRSLKTIYELFADAGWKRGLVTTTEITHATPAGFSVNVTSRGSSDDIAKQYFDRRIDLLLGGGRNYFDKARRKDKRDLLGDFAQAGYALMQTRADLAAAPLDKPWLGTFAKSHLPFTVDHVNMPKALAEVPTLAEMTDAALRKLEREPHFILQVEGGRVDQGAHTNDAPAAFRDQIAFDEALDVCLAFQKRHPDTLLVITTDHATGNPGLNAVGKEYNLSVPLFQNIPKVTKSLDEIAQQIKGLVEFDPEGYKGESTKTGKLVDPSIISDIVYESSGYRPSIKRCKKLHQFFSGKGDALYDLANNDAYQLGQLMANYVGIGWNSTGHTSDYVPILATGPGAEKFRGFVQNTDVFRHYTGFAGIDFRNPDLPLMAEAGPTATEAEDYEFIA